MSTHRLLSALSSLPCVRAVHVSPHRVRIELSRWSWFALGAIHGYVRGTAEAILAREGTPCDLEVL